MSRAAIALVLIVASAAAFAQDTLQLRPTIRDVTAPGMTPAPRVDGPLERLPTPPRPPEPARWWRFYLPETTDAATFVTEGRVIRVAGVEAPDVTRACPSPEGGEWPCGRMALTSLRLFLRGRAVECFYRLDEEGSLVAPCRVGPTDIGGWLLTQGWATAAADAGDDYRHDVEEARCAGRGLWRGQATAGCKAAAN